MSTVKKYTAIAAVLGWTEFEPQEDGLFLQPEEATAIDTALANATAVQTQLDVANTSVTSLQEQIAKMHSAESVKTLNDRITALEAENKELGKKSSGTGTALEVGEEEQETGAPKKKHTMSSAEHPVGAAVKQEVEARKEAKKFKASYGM